MCGIIGSNLNLSECSFKEALKTLERRGPDIQQFQKEDDFLFGHARLAIVDLDDRSNQPFFYKHNNQEIILIFNGEIYNFLIVKQELISLGYTFKTNSDTEVVAAGYLAWGKDCFNKLTGMWALAVYEKASKKIIFSRDRVGKKPLYIFDDNKGEIIFSSTLKALKKISNSLKLDVNPEAIELYFALGFIPEQYTIYNTVFKVKPGEIIEYNCTNKGYYKGIISQSLFKPSINTSIPIGASIEQAVKNRMLSDVPYCTLLSSGVDSTIISYYCKKNNPKIEAFTVGFNDPKLNELNEAKKIAKRIGITLQELFLEDKDIKEAFKEYYEVYEEPFADYSGIPTIALFKKIGKHYRLAFTGDGGDEIFYGYPHYNKKFILYLLNRAQKILPFIKLVLPSKLNEILMCSKTSIESEYLKLNFCVTTLSKSVIDNKFAEILEENKGFLRSTIDYDRMLNNLPEKYLVKVDRASMYSSVEVRSPFMDEDLKEKMKTVSLWKIFTPFSLKIFLKLKYIKLFGISYLFAKKKGFTPPIKKLVEESFIDNDYQKFKVYIKQHSPEVFDFYVNKSFEDINKNKLQFYRIYFFYKWLENQNLV